MSATADVEARAAGRAATSRAGRPGGAGRPSGGGPTATAAMGPAQKSLDFGPSAQRLLGRLRPDRGQVALVVVLAVAQRRPDRRSGRRSSATPPT